MKFFLPHVTQVLFFLLVGIVTLGIDIGVTAFMFYAVNLPAFLASAIGFCSGFFFNFPINRKIVFNHSDYDRFGLRQQITMVICLSACNLVATSLLVEVLVSHYNIEIQYAKILTALIIAVWNFVLFKLVIFSKKSI